MKWLVPVLLCLLPALVQAQARIPSACIALSQATPQVIPASFGEGLAQDTVLIRYLDHASFAIVAGDVVAVTDYTGFIGNPDVVPDVVTMNNAHATHYTDSPDPRIAHVLRGWPAAGLPAFHELDLGAMFIRNVTTDTRGPFGEGALANGNSIFVFEAGGLCIAHLGHLHQIPSAAQYAAIGRVDVVMVPVDGGYTMDAATMGDVVRHLRPQLVLPMHWFSTAALAEFAGVMTQDFAIVQSPDADVIVGRGLLPEQPTLMVLTPALIP